MGGRPLSTTTEGLSAQEYRVAATACMAAAGVRRSIGSFLLDDEPDRVSVEALTLETVGAKLAALAETLDGNRLTIADAVRLAAQDDPRGEADR
jgi:hypothetical protein